MTDIKTLIAWWLEHYQLGYTNRPHTTNGKILDTITYLRQLDTMRLEGL